MIKLVKYLFKETKNELRFRFVNKFHIVDTKLGPGYYDVDTRMLHACFSLLEDFVEKEEPYKYLEEEISKGKAAELDEWAETLVEREEVMELYNWWKKYSANMTPSWGSNKDDEDIELTQLIRLMKIRNRLWT